MYAIMNKTTSKYLMNFSEHLGPNNFEILKFTDKEQAEQYLNRLSDLNEYKVVQYQS